MNIDWGQVFIIITKVVSAILAGAVAGYNVNGTWDGAATGAITALGGLFVQAPQTHQIIKNGTNT